ncbi:pilin [Limnohabitans sp. Rim8]|uniref:pilin n=1 Tax=Limnohabitans sp. Rim8 TaxID=1100718 RepID=UPI002627CAA9|nr:pilin [Limnohabitans sp. Rim8]
MQKRQQGLTLIELMIVIAIIGILGALALPAYQDYSIRAKVSEMLLATSGCKTAVNEAIGSASEADVSASLSRACDTQTSKYVTSIGVDANGVITVVGNHQALRGSTSASANSLSLTPLQAGTTAVNGSTDGGKPVASWRCGPAATNGLPTKYLPASCKAQ